MTYVTRNQWVNSLRPRPDRRHFADDIFKCIFKNENEWISPRISLKFVPKFRINNIPALVHIMAWRRPGDKPLSEPMMVKLPTHICVARPQWVKGSHTESCPYYTFCPGLFVAIILKQFFSSIILESKLTQIWVKWLHPLSMSSHGNKYLSYQ